MAVFSNLNDRFDEIVLDTTKFTSFATGTSTFAIGGGVITCTPPNTTAGSNYAGVDNTGANRDLTGNFVFVQVPTVTNTATNAQTYLKIAIDGSNFIDIYQQAGTLHARKTVATVQTDLGNTTYSSTAHQWWLIAEVQGTTYFQTSYDGLTFTNLITPVANPITLTSVFVEFAAGTFQSETSPGAATFKNFNINNTFKRLNKGLRPHPFSPGLAR